MSEGEICEKARGLQRRSCMWEESMSVYRVGDKGLRSGPPAPSMLSFGFWCCCLGLLMGGWTWLDSIHCVEMVYSATDCMAVSSSRPYLQDSYALRTLDSTAHLCPPVWHD